MKHRFRPQRSVSLPPGIISAAITSRKIVIAVCTPCTVVSRSSLMSLIITFMFEPAKLQMNCARASGTSTRRAGRLRRAYLAAPYLPVLRVGSRAASAPDEQRRSSDDRLSPARLRPPGGRRCRRRTRDPVARRG